MPTYNSTTKGPVDITAMNTGHIINALNKQAKEAAASEKVSPQKLQLIGEFAAELVSRGFALQAVLERNN